MDESTYREVSEAVANLEEVVSLAVTSPGLLYKAGLEDRVRMRHRIAKLQRRVNAVQQLLNFVGQH